MVVKASLARSTLVDPTVTAKVLVTWEQNSTDIPTVMTKLTKETAFREMSHQYINPPKLVRIMKMIVTIMAADLRSIPMRKNVTKKIAANDMPRDCKVSSHIVRYCS